MRDLNDLSFFTAVVSHRGFSAAARALGLPKSRLSRRVASLEADLGVRLLERSTRRLNVTQVGEDIYNHARAALTEAGAIEEIAERLKAEPRGLVRATCPIGFDRLIAARLPELLLRHPQLRLQLTVTNRRVDLIEEGVDFAVRAGQPSDADASFQMKPIGRAGAILAATPGLLQAFGRPLRPPDLVALPTVSISEGPAPDRWELIDPAGDLATVIHEPRLLANSLPVARAAVLEGIGVGLLPEFACNEPLADGRLECVLPGWRRADGLLHIVFASRRGLLPSVRAAIDFITETLNPRTICWDAVL
ncbi:MAG TPA: LysR substrate-binding domain-containing protein [Caulobacteraceae bacterium]|nr:LysR substrate-binding domain-containing protein [Caulobacteraceae bacterium]